jgi:hypothetical protein
MNDQQQLPNTAITTWSGFVYQGKISLLHCLKLISIGFNDVRGYKLQLESIDDFAILDSNDNCKSMHQVKAYKECRFSKYQSAIEKQQGDSKKHPQADVFFHVSRAMTNFPVDFDIDFSPVAIYEYDKEEAQVNFCGLNEVNDLIEEKIKEIYIQHYPGSEYKTSSEYLLRCRNMLEDITVNKVINIHHKIQINKGSVERQLADSETIHFDDFFNLLDSDLHEDIQNEDYFFYVLRKDTGDYFKEYCDEIDADDDGCLEKLNWYISKINSLNKEGFKHFICSILPHKKGDFCTLKEYKNNTLNEEDFKNGLFFILEKLVESKLGGDLYPFLFYWNDGNENYYPTAIRDGKPHLKKFCEQMIKGSLNDDLDFLYESGKLITVCMDCKSIFSEVNVGPYSIDERDKNGYLKINSFKNVSLISIENAKDKLND